jgi:hypothetical protein
MKYIDTER